MNGEIQNFIERVVATYPLAGRVLEIGSRDICGSARRWFTKDGQQTEPTERFPEYIGIDLVSGNLVDLIMNGNNLTYPKESFNVVISTSALEHDPVFWLTMHEMRRVMVSGGYLILTVPSWRGGPPHDAHDYYRFMAEGVEYLVKMAGFEIIELVDHEPSDDVMCLARKP